MRVERDNKTLYHIQNLNLGDTPFDAFLWCDHFPTDEDLRKVAEDEWAGVEEDTKQKYTEELLATSEVYMVCALGTEENKQ